MLLLGVLFVLVLILAAVGLASARSSPSTMDWPERLLAGGFRTLPEDRREWGEAMMAELAALDGASARWRFALGCAWVALFPPRRNGFPVSAIAALTAVAAAGVWLAMLDAPPVMRVFTATFVALLGAWITLAVARSRRPSVAAPGLGLSAFVVTGVAGCVVIAMLTYRATTDSAPQASPVASHGLLPVNAVLVLFACVAVGYLWLAFTPPRAVTTSRQARRVGGLGGLAFGLAFLGDLALGYHYDDVPWAMLATNVIFFGCAALAGVIGRSVRAGIEAALWAGLVSGLLFFAIDMLVIFEAIRGGPQPQVLAEFWRSGASDLGTFWIGEDLAAGVVMLMLFPAWALLLGVAGARVGRRIS